MIIRPEIDLKNILLNIEKPGRYIGGEFGKKKPLDEDIQLKIALCFPDLYEIGMSNNAVRILFDLCNSIPHVLCDLVFSPAPDFEKILHDKEIPLYTLEYGIPLHECDVLAFTVGYELAATNILAVLETGLIPLHTEDRTERHPIVIAGGPAITNPAPFGAWIDGIFIGDSESEPGLGDILKKLVKAKKSNKNREGKLLSLEEHPSIWSKRKPKAVALVNQRFGLDQPVSDQYFLAPNISIVQEHGVIEIMRGCPNGCRFCHAGEFYRPYRQKDIPKIIDEVDFNLKNYGYREITLSSLSTGDYPHLDKLISSLNKRHEKNHISFSLPSLKVNSFTLPVLKAVSTVRRSGLTFAIETPEHNWQMAMNKEVLCEDIISIIKQAKDLGWKLAKFYFMTGLPFTDLEREPEAIAGFLSEIYKATKIRMNINIGTFVPKPHTPFQWSNQLEPDFALNHLKNIKALLIRRLPQVKVSFHDSYTSYLEGMVSRGDERVSDIIEKAYFKGSRLDAWDEYFNKNNWVEAIEETSWDVLHESCDMTPIDAPLPWDDISVGAGKGFLKNEYALASRFEPTPICAPVCDHNCGVCNPKKMSEILDAETSNETFVDDHKPEVDIAELPKFIHIIATYKKNGKAIYYSHINMMNIFERMFMRTGIPIEFTHGFNPKPRLEFASPLPLGVSGKEEVMLFRIPDKYKNELFKHEILELCNNSLPDGVDFISFNTKGLGHKSISSAYSGSAYTFSIDSDDDTKELFRITELIVQEQSNVTLLTTDGTSATVSIFEQKGKVGNILKLIDPEMKKYDFLSRYNVKRIELYGKSGENLAKVLTEEAR